MEDASQKAGFILRAAAYFVDFFITWLVIVTVAVILVSLEIDLEGLDSIYGLLFLLYLALATGLYGTTLGKRVFKLRVVTYEDTKPSMRKAFLRDFLGKIISSIPFSLGFFWVIWDKNKQAWHDKIAKTYVVIASPIGKGRKILAYLLVFGLPALAIIGILIVFFLVVFDPLGRMEKAREDAQQQQLWQEFQQLQNIEGELI